MDVPFNHMGIASELALPTDLHPLNNHQFISETEIHTHTTQFMFRALFRKDNNETCTDLTDSDSKVLMEHVGPTVLNAKKHKQACICFFVPICLICSKLV